VEPRAFTSHEEATDVAVLIVTFNSEKDIPRLLESLRLEAEDQSIKVVVADNSPNARTLGILAQHHDVLAFSTGGNLGYAGAINAARRRAGAAGTYLVLNPDLSLVRGAVLALRQRMASVGAGVVVPRLLDEDGSTYPSLRREPSFSRALGDALLGSKMTSRPAWLSEINQDPKIYSSARPIEWATGAALLIRSDVAEVVGDWDERYFLYSEETDYMRRVRECGFAVWFEPLAIMTHTRGGSGSSIELEALMAANRIRYVLKFHSKGYALAFRAAVVLSALLRAPLPGRRGIFLLLLLPSKWGKLPCAIKHSPVDVQGVSTPPGSVIIPAHNEAAVLARTLEALRIPLNSGEVEVLVACNGCSDGTEDIARGVAGVQVIVVPEASKVSALNAGDRAATRWPRLYVDADIELPPEALSATFNALSDADGILCARPAFRYNTDGASWLVRAYYRARNRLPLSSASMWGAGVYALSLQGHTRMGQFPPVTADDCFIDGLFAADEKIVVDCKPVIVRTPRSALALLSTLKRIYRGNAALPGGPETGPMRTLRQVIGAVKGPASGLDALVYITFALVGRTGPRQSHVWERDESSRSMGEAM
jgi:GT2 family glycosyltransferase